MYRDHVPLRDRIGPAALTAAVAGGIGWALLSGLALRGGGPVQDESLATFDVTPPPPPVVRIMPRRQRSRRPEGRAAPPGLRAEATQLVAPPPVIPLPPTPVVTAPIAGIGEAPRQGAAERPGPGPGAGGIGDGRGSGGDGEGDGGPGYETEPRWLRGRLSFADGARVAGEAVIGRAISVRCTLRVDQRLSDCTVAQSSGIPALDRRMIELIERRFRYTPWLDADGRPVESTILIDQSWDEEP